MGKKESFLMGKKEIAVLKEFYLTGDAFPVDTSPFNVAFVQKKLLEHNKFLKYDQIYWICQKFVKEGVLRRTFGVNPTIYSPLEDKIDVVKIRAFIQFFELIFGSS